MREIIFRGKSEANGKWCYGNLQLRKNDDCIITPDDTPLGIYGKVDRETVGQYTGLKDKNGVEIYEGDIFHMGDRNIIYIVEWHDTGLKGRQYNNQSFVGLCYWKNSIEVIGNIYENKELLEGE